MIYIVGALGWVLAIVLYVRGYDPQVIVKEVLVEKPKGENMEATDFVGFLQKYPKVLPDAFLPFSFTELNYPLMKSIRDAQARAVQSEKDTDLLRKYKP